MEPLDVLLSLVFTSASLGCALGLIVGSAITLWLKDCPRCTARESLEGQGYRAFPDRPRLEKGGEW